MGLNKPGLGGEDEPWEIEQVLKAVVGVYSSWAAPYTIVLYSKWDLATMQKAMGSNKDLKKSKLEVSEYLMIKVTF